MTHSRHHQQYTHMFDGACYTAPACLLITCWRVYMYMYTYVIYTLIEYDLLSIVYVLWRVSHAAPAYLLIWAGYDQ